MKMRYSQPELPHWVEGAALEVWNDLVGPLAEIHAFIEIDAEVFGRYCVMAARFRELAADIMARGEFTVNANGDEVIRPQAKQALAYSRDLIRLENQLGLSPAARTAIKVRGETVAQKKADEAAEVDKKAFFRTA